MQTVIGNVTADAKVNQTSDGRNVVNFTLALNDRFKVKGSDEVKQVTNYYSCSYWMGTGIAPHIKKGSLVEVAGRIGVNAWEDKEGKAKADLTLHVQFIRLHGKAKNSVATTPEMEPAEAAGDDLPF